MSVITPNCAFLSRRRLLQGTAGAAGLAAAGLAGQEAKAAKELVVGFIYVGPKDDYGYNQAHAEAAAMLKKMPGVKRPALHGAAAVATPFIQHIP